MNINCLHLHGEADYWVRNEYAKMKADAIAVELAAKSGKKLYEDVTEQSYKVAGIKWLGEYIDKGLELTDAEGWVRLVAADRVKPGREFANVVVKPTLAVVTAGVMFGAKLAEENNATLTLPVAQALAPMVELLLDYGMSKERNVKEFRQDVIRDLLLSPFLEFCDNFGLVSSAVLEKLDNYIAEKKRQSQEYAQAYKLEKTARTEKNAKKIAKLLQLVAAYEGKRNAVFVYGSFMRGETLNSVIANGTYADRWQLKHYSCYQTERGPIIAYDYNGVVMGELYFLDDAVVQTIDHYAKEHKCGYKDTLNFYSRWGKMAAKTYVMGYDYWQTPEGVKIEGRWTGRK